jgi:hypothetical protein
MVCRDFVPERLVTEYGHQPGEVMQRPNCGEECLEVHPRGAPVLRNPTVEQGRKYYCIRMPQRVTECTTSLRSTAVVGKVTFLLC